MPGLPANYWSKKSLSKLASVLGKPLHTDGYTLQKNKVIYARILVEIDLSQPLKEVIRIKKREKVALVQQIQYESVPAFCQQCPTIGHKCANRPPTRAPHQVRVADPQRRGDGGRKGQQWVEVGTRRTRGQQPAPIPVRADSTGNRTTDASVVANTRLNGAEPAQVANDTTTAVTNQNGPAVSGSLECPPRVGVKQAKAGQVRKCFVYSWDCVDNYCSAVNGRVWVVWDTSQLHFQPIVTTDQAIHGYVNSNNGLFSAFITFIYGLNERDDRRSLWSNLRSIAGMVHEPWLILGDFNNVLNSEDRIGGTPVSESECIEFRDVLNETELQELGVRSSRCKPQFRFLNCLVDHPDFLPTVIDAWSTSVNGVRMFSVWSKLNRVKEQIKKMQNAVSRTGMHIDAAREKVEACQNLLKQDPLNQDLYLDLVAKQREYDRWLNIDEQILKQKSKVHWLLCGDGNNRYFHDSLKARGKSIISVLYDEMGRKLTDEE
ncbi:hypothetical protein OROGR_002198 [Orobanche gracilis]